MDISIRGAGIFGLTIAFYAVNAGATVELVDPNGVASGASGGIVGALAPHVPENWNAKKQFQLDSLLMAEAFWADVEQKSNRPSGYAKTGRLQPLEPAAIPLAKTRAQNAKTLWRGQADWSIMSAQMDWKLAKTPSAFVLDTLSAHIHPKQACNALAAALAQSGVTVQPSPSAHANATIWATGHTGLAAVSEGKPRIMGQGIKGQAALLELDKRGAPQLFVDGLHVIPHHDGTVAVGSTTERDYGDPFDTDHLLDDVLSRACATVPDLASAKVLQRWANLRPRARSRAPMLGPWPDHDGHFIANGGFKIGFGMAPKIGKVMTDLVLNGIDAIPEGFRVSDNA